MFQHELPLAKASLSLNQPTRGKGEITNGSPPKIGEAERVAAGILFIAKLFSSHNNQDPQNIAKVE
jgi:hypothetical protein